MIAPALAAPIVRLTRRRGSIHDAPKALSYADIAARLRELEGMAARLTVSRVDPEKFHEDRSELKAGISALAKQLEAR